MAEIQEPPIRKRLDDILKHELPTITLVAGLYYLYLAIMYARLLPARVSRPLVQLALISALLSMGLWLALRTWPKQVHRAHPILGAQFGLALFNHTILIALTEDIQQTTHIALLLVITGVLTLSKRWLSVLILIALGSWLVVAPGAVHTPEWWQSGWNLLSATAIAAVAHTLRRRSYERLERIQTHYEGQQHIQRYLLQQLKTNLAIEKRLSMDEDLDTLLDQTVEILKKDYGCSYVGILLLDEDGRHLVARVGTGDAGRAAIMRGTRVQMGRGLVGWSAQHRQIVRVADASRDPRFVTWDLMPNTRSELVLPLMAGERLMGALDMQSQNISHFQAFELAPLEILGRHVTLAVQNNILRKEGKRHEQLSDSLYNIGRALARPMGQQQLLDLILHQLLAVIPYDRGSVMLRQGDGMDMVATRGFPNREGFPKRVPIHPGDVFDEIRHTQRPLLIDDALQRPDWFHIDSILPARSWMGIPLIHNDAVIGMLSLAREVLSPYTEDEVTFAMAFAIQATIALEKAYLHDQVEHLIRELDPALKDNDL